MYSKTSQRNKARLWGHAAAWLLVCFGLLGITSRAEVISPVSTLFLSTLDQNASSYFTAVHLGDFNNDGVSELAWSCYDPVIAGQNYLRMADINSFGLITNSETYGAGVQDIGTDQGPYNFTPGDFNGDGIDDLLYINRQGTFMLYRNTTAIGSPGNQFLPREGGTSYFTTLISQSTTMTIDTAMTMVTGGSSNNPTGGPNMSVMLRNADANTPLGTAGLTAVITHDLGGGAQMIGQGDLTGDGVAESIFFHPSNDFSAKTLSGLPGGLDVGVTDQIKGPGAGTGSNHGPFDGTHLPDESIHPGGYSFRMKTGFVVETWEGCRLIVGDLSRDGRPELIANMYADDGKGYLFSYQRKAPNYGAGHVSGEVATGDRGYEWEVVDILDTEIISAVAPGDYNNDGLTDLVAGTRKGKIFGYQRKTAGFNADNSTALQDYTRQLIYAPSGANPCPITGIALGDADGDNVMEIAFTTSLAGVSGTADPVPGTYLINLQSAPPTAVNSADWVLFE